MKKVICFVIKLTLGLFNQAYKASKIQAFMLEVCMFHFYCFLTTFALDETIHSMMMMMSLYLNACRTLSYYHCTKAEANSLKPCFFLASPYSDVGLVEL